MEIILASASPRREMLLREFAKDLVVVPAHIDEAIHQDERFADACVRLARKKALQVAKENRGAVVIGADTIAYKGRENYRKTDDKRKARAILQGLSGRTHNVITGVAVVFPSGKCVAYSVKADVKMKEISELELENYLETDDWKGRAGSYDISGEGKSLVAGVKGEVETVVGLPIKKLRRLLGK